MSNPRNNIAIIQFHPAIRRELLKMAPPRFSRVYANKVTLAYNVPRTFRLPRYRQMIEVKAVIDTPTYQSLLVTVNGAYARPDGKLYHITVSVPDHVPPATAGNFDHDDVEMFGRRVTPYQFSGEPKLVPRMVMPWDTLEQARELVAA